MMQDNPTVARLNAEPVAVSECGDAKRQVGYLRGWRFCGPTARAAAWLQADDSGPNFSPRQRFVEEAEIASKNTAPPTSTFLAHRYLSSLYLSGAPSARRQLNAPSAKCC